MKTSVSNDIQVSGVGTVDILERDFEQLSADTPIEIPAGIFGIRAYLKGILQSAHRDATIRCRVNGITAGYLSHGQVTGTANAGKQLTDGFLVGMGSKDVSPVFSAELLLASVDGADRIVYHGLSTFRMDHQNAAYRLYGFQLTGAVPCSTPLQSVFFDSPHGPIIGRARIEFLRNP